VKVELKTHWQKSGIGHYSDWIPNLCWACGNRKKFKKYRCCVPCVKYIGAAFRTKLSLNVPEPTRWLDGRFVPYDFHRCVVCDCKTGGGRMCGYCWGTRNVKMSNELRRAGRRVKCCSYCKEIKPLDSYTTNGYRYSRCKRFEYTLSRIEFRNECNECHKLKGYAVTRLASELELETKEIRPYKEIIEAKRNIIKINRTIKNKKYGNTTTNIRSN
jgi:hypothetical protein